MSYEDSDDYIKVEGFVPRFDNDGNEVTNENLGSGGIRRVDGTLSAQIKSPRIVDDLDEVSPYSPPYDPFTDPEKISQKAEPETFLEAVIKGAVEGAVERVMLLCCVKLI